MEFRAFGGLFPSLEYKEETRRPHWAGGRPIAVQDTKVLTEQPDSQTVKDYKGADCLSGERGFPSAANPVWRIDFALLPEKR